MEELTWYEVNKAGNPLKQGDLLMDIPIIIPPQEYSLGSTPTVEIYIFDVIVLTQTCDLVHNNVSYALVCPVYFVEKYLEKNPAIKFDSFMEELKKHRRLGFFLLDACRIKGHERDFSFADYRNTLSVPINILKQNENKDRLSLQSPYREDFSAKFASFISRIAYPKVVTGTDPDK